MRKTFIEASRSNAATRGIASRSLPLMRKTFIEAHHYGAMTVNCETASLPLMRKTFIEATKSEAHKIPEKKSLPLMRKTFIEAPPSADTACSSSCSLFRLCGRLSLRHCA